MNCIFWKAKINSKFFCEFSFADQMTYVNLQLNPERYTGYSGPSARRIWDAVYSENCPKCNSFSLKILLGSCDQNAT